MSRLVLLALFLVPALTGCGEGAGREGEGVPVEVPTEVPGDVSAKRPADSVTVVFTRDEEPAPTRRPVPGASADLRTALEWHVRGPTPDERDDGIHSWFSPETAGALRSVAVDSDGRAIVDFVDLRPLIANASTSAGSRMLLIELNGTVFQFAEIRTVEYRMEGSCAAFWEWLQHECHVVSRPVR
jgi:hypothetical protein